MTMHRIGKLLTKGPSSRILPHVVRTTTRGYTTSVEDGSARGSGRAFATQAAAEPFLSGSSSTYVEEMYLAWQRDPNSVHKVIFNCIASFCFRFRCRWLHLTWKCLFSAPPPSSPLLLKINVFEPISEMFILTLLIICFQLVPYGPWTIMEQLIIL